MREKVNPENRQPRRESTPHGEGVYTDKTIDQWLAERAQQKPDSRQPRAPRPQPQPRAPQQPPAGRYPQYAQSAPQQQPPRSQQAPRPEDDSKYAAWSRQNGSAESERGKFEIHLPKTRRGRLILGAAAAGLALVGGIFVANVGNAPDASDGTASVNLDLDLVPVETLGSESLKKGQCDTPEAILMVARVTGHLPLVPMIATTEQPTAAPMPKYMNEDTKDELSGDEAKKFEKFITEDEYPLATTHELPMGLSVCQPADGEAAITQTEDGLIVNRSLLSVKFEDPDSLFGRNIVQGELQTDGATVADLNPEEGEFVTIPDPAYNMFLVPNEADPVYTQSVTDLGTNMKNPAQHIAILAKMEAEAIQQLDSVVDGHENIHYPEGAESLENAIDNVLVKRIVGDENVHLTFTGNYKITPELPKDPATKEAAPLLQLDPSQKFEIENITLEYGALPEPEIITPPPAEETEEPEQE